MIASLLVLLQTPPAFEPASPESQGIDSARLEELADVVQGWVEGDRIVGAELLVIRNDRTVLHRGFGWKHRAEEVAMTPGGVFCVRSMTKAVVGTAVQLLIDERRLSPRDRVSRYLPSFDNERSREITVGHLLTHTSGLPLSSLIGRELGSLSGERAIADLVGEKGPTFPPGEGFHYSDDNADVLGALVEEITGRDLSAFLHERLFEPLGMHETAAVMSLDHPLRARVCSSYTGSPGTWIRYWGPEDPPLFPFLLASQGLYTSALDYARFLYLWKERGRAGGARLLSMRAVRRAFEPASAMRTPSAFEGAEVRYGQMMQLWVRSTDDGGEELLAFGHGGSDGTVAWVFPKLDLMVLYFTQSRNSMTVIEIGQHVQRLLVDPLVGVTSAAPLAYDEHELDAFAGFYWKDDGQQVLAVLRRGDALAVEFPGRALVDLAPTPSRDVFQFRFSPEYRLEFERDPSGAVVAHTSVRRGDRARRPRLFPAADLPSVDEILALRQTASDRESIEALGAVSIRSTVDIGGLGVSGTSIEGVQGLGRFTRAIDYGDFQESSLLVDGRGWTWTSRTEPEELGGPRLETLRLDHPFAPIVDWRILYRRVEVLARVERDGEAALVLRAEPQAGNAHTWTVSLESGLPLTLAAVDFVAGLGEVGSVTTYGDWRAVGSLRLPFRRHVAFATPLLGELELVWESVEEGVVLPPDAFEPPGRKRGG